MDRSISLPLKGRLLPSAVGSLFVFGMFLTPALAQKTSFTDVPSGAYYEDAAAALLSSGALDQEATLRPAALAARSELVKLLVNLNQVPLSSPAVGSFNDVSKGTWYYSYFEAAAKMTWVHGDGNCYGQFRPCYARPASQVNRAEAAALLVRAFGLKSLGTAPRFTDNRSGQWYYSDIQTAADNCVLQGDGVSGDVRPDSSMNRAEMVVMFYRATQNMQYGRDCGVSAPHISDASAQTSNDVRLTFNENIRASVAQIAGHYSVRRVSDGKIVGVSSATVNGNRVVDLALNADLDAGTDYTVSIDGLVSTDGVTFSDTVHFMSLGQAGSIIHTTVPSSRRVVMQFDTDLNAACAQISNRYTVNRVSGGSIAVVSATLTNSRTVELLLADDMAVNIPYQVSASSLLTSGGVSFSDSDTFTFQAVAGALSGVSVTSSTRLMLDFTMPLDSVRAETLSSYTVSDGVHNLALSSARIIGQKTVELNLSEALLSQRSYTLTVQNMLTNQGASFNATNTFIFNVSGTTNFSATLTGAQETPAVVTSAMGTGSFVLTMSGLQYDITVRGLSGSQITAAHFHNGLTGVAGPVLQPITFTGTHATGTWVLSATDRNLLLDGKVYVNVHSNQYPNGEIRAQLHQ